MADPKTDDKVQMQAVGAGESRNSDSGATSGARCPSSLLQGSSRDVLLKYTHCAQCQSRLHFSYLTDFSRNLTQETARCPECQNQAHRVMHRLQ